MKTEPWRLRLSQALLGSVTGAEQAVTIVGDLYEAAGRSRRAFIRDVLGATTALALQSLLHRPGRNAALLALSAGLWCLCYVTVRLSFAWAGWLSLAGRGTATAGMAPEDCLVAGGLHGVVLAAALIAAGVLCGSLLGLLQHREAGSPALPLSALFIVAAPTLAGAELLSTGSLSWHCLVTYFVVLPLCYALPLIASAALTRAWQLRSFECDAQTSGNGQRPQ